MNFREKVIKLRYNLLVAFLSGVVATFETTTFFVSFIISFFVIYKYSAFIKNNYLIIFYPFLMFTCWLSSGGVIFTIPLFKKFFKIEIMELPIFENMFVTVILGICGAIVVSLLTKLFFKINLRTNHLLLYLLLIPIPYLLGLNPAKEFGNSIFLFYFIFNFILLSVLQVTFKNEDLNNKITI